MNDDHRPLDPPEPGDDAVPTPSDDPTVDLHTAVPHTEAVGAALRAVEPVDDTIRTSHLASALAAFDALGLADTQLTGGPVSADDPRPTRVTPRPITILPRRGTDVWGRRLAVAAGLVVVAGVGLLVVTGDRRGGDSSASSSARDAAITASPSKEFSAQAVIPATTAAAATTITARTDTNLSGGAATSAAADAIGELGSFSTNQALATAARTASRSAPTTTTGPAPTGPTSSREKAVGACPAARGTSPMWQASVGATAVFVIVDPVGVRIIDPSSCRLIAALADS
jgi:hypothetical protein